MVFIFVNERESLVAVSDNDSKERPHTVKTIGPRLTIGDIDQMDGWPTTA